MTDLEPVAQFRVGDHVLVDGDRPEDGGWWITEIIDDNPDHDGPFAMLRDVDGGRSWAALRILRHYEPLPDLPDFLDALELLARRLLALLKRGYDPETGPSTDDVSGISYVQCRLMCAASDANSLLRMLGEVTAVLPPTMTTGPTTGEGRSPGLAQVGSAPGVSSNGAVVAPAQAYSFPTTGGIAGVHPRNGALGGESAPGVAPPQPPGQAPISDPRPRHTHLVLNSSGVRPGVGFTGPTQPPPLPLPNPGPPPAPGVLVASAPITAGWLR